MTERQQAFCEYYIASGNATESAKKAGYSEKTAYSSGQRLLKNVEVAKAIQEASQKASNARIATADEVLEYLSETLRDGSESRRERTKAAELLGKRYRLFEEAKTSAGDSSGVTVKHVKADMSDEELKELLENE